MRRGLYWFSLGAQSLLYIGAGSNHLWHPLPYLHIVPPHYTHPQFWVAATGIAEIAGGVGLLVPATRRAAATGILAMLVGYLDVHVFMLRHGHDLFGDLPYWALVARLPLQGVLIAWAWLYARRSPR